jgi:hypothetical protein
MFLLQTSTPLGRAPRKHVRAASRKLSQVADGRVESRPITLHPELAELTVLGNFSGIRS